METEENVRSRVNVKACGFSQPSLPDRPETEVQRTGPPVTIPACTIPERQHCMLQTFENQRRSQDQDLNGQTIARNPGASSRSSFTTENHSTGERLKRPAFSGKSANGCHSSGKPKPATTRSDGADLRTMNPYSSISLILKA